METLGSLGGSLLYYVCAGLCCLVAFLALIGLVFILLRKKGSPVEDEASVPPVRPASKPIASAGKAMDPPEPVRPAPSPLRSAPTAVPDVEPAAPPVRPPPAPPPALDMVQIPDMPEDEVARTVLIRRKKEDDPDAS
jgi:hypothetical protein